MKASQKLIAGLILLVSLGIQITVVWFFNHYWWLLLTLIPFILISFILSLPLSSEIGRILNLYRYLVILTGPFATLGCFLILFLSPRQELACRYHEFLAADVIFSPSERMSLGLGHQFWQMEDDSITPYIDIMEGTSIPLKRNTINKVIQHPGPNSRNILDIGLNDSDPEIRFYAASALILLNDSFIKEFRDIGEKIKTEPTNSQFHFELASSYDRYCTWKLAEKEDHANYYLKIEDSYQASLNLDPHNLNAMIGLSRVRIKRKDFQGASQILQKGLELFPNSAILKLQQLKLLFRQKKYSELSKTAELYLIEFPNVALEIQESVSFWIKSDKFGNEYEYNFS